MREIDTQSTNITEIGLVEIGLQSRISLIIMASVLMEYVYTIDRSITFTQVGWCYVLIHTTEENTVFYREVVKNTAIYIVIVPLIVRCLLMYSLSQ